METVEVKAARLEVQVAGLREDVTDIRADQKAQNAKLDVLVAAEERRKGGRAVGRVLVATLTSGGFLGWVWEHFHK